MMVNGQDIDPVDFPIESATRQKSQQWEYLNHPTVNL